MSSATFHKNARGALRAHLATCPLMVPEGRRAYEGFSFKPITGTGEPQPFIEDKLVPLLDEARSHGAIEHKIGYLMTLKFPPNKGTADIEELAGNLLDHFKVGTKLTHGGTTILSYGAERRGAIVQEVDWQVLTVSAEFQAFTIE